MLILTFRVLQEKNAYTRHKLITLITLFHEEIVLIFQEICSTLHCKYKQKN